MKYRHIQTYKYNVLSTYCTDVRRDTNMHARIATGGTRIALTADIHDGDGDDEAAEGEHEEPDHPQEVLLVAGEVTPRHLGLVAAAKINI